MAALPLSHRPLVALLSAALCSLAVVTVAVADDPIYVGGPGTTIDRSGVVTIAERTYEVRGDAAAIRVVGDGLVLDFGGQTLRGAPASRNLDALDGIGILIEGRDVTLRNLRLDGFRVGILARRADGLTLEEIEVVRNYGQRLRSGASAEDVADWLRPHDNDLDQWRTHYGAGVCIESSSNVTLRRIQVRRSQNGIILSNVRRSRIHDNDCSFLSGWGLAMWRSSENVVSRNAFDFCVRGYSHGVYNRGQDSAGILLFEQCERNVFVENSATHGGDGVFGFAGIEALGQGPRLGERPGAEHDPDDRWHARRGCNDNIFLRNDLSDAVAHGLELTFSFGNIIAENRFAGNAICGIWAGYSHDTTIAGNRFARNGDRGYGLERGGVNIEHGTGNAIVNNVFEANRCGIHLWWDADEPIMRSPWARANDTASRDNTVAHNRFEDDEVAIHLRENGRVTIFGNTKRDVGTELLADETSRAAIERPAELEFGLPAWGNVVAIGDSSPVGARGHLRGRERIIMTEWGPYDWSGPLVHLADRRADRDVWALLGEQSAELAQVFGRGPLRVQTSLSRREYRIVSERPGWVLPYRLMLRLEDGTRIEREGLIFPARWDVRLFAWATDPRTDLAAWRQESESAVRLTLPFLRLRFGSGGPGDMAAELVAEALMPHTADGPGPAPGHGENLTEEDAGALRTALESLPRDRFGTIAQATLRFPRGRWRLSTLSDDGVRVIANGETIIDNWTWHAPTTDDAVLEFDEWTDVELVVEHFELDGHAVLELKIEPAPHD